MPASRRDIELTPCGPALMIRWSVSANPWGSSTVGLGSGRWITTRVLLGMINLLAPGLDLLVYEIFDFALKPCHWGAARNQRYALGKLALGRKEVDVTLWEPHPIHHLPDADEPRSLVFRYGLCFSVRHDIYLKKSQSARRSSLNWIRAYFFGNVFLSYFRFRWN